MGVRFYSGFPQEGFVDCFVLELNFKFVSFVFDTVCVPVYYSYYVVCYWRGARIEMKEWIILVIIVVWSFSEVRAVSKLMNSKRTSTILILLATELEFSFVAIVSIVALRFFSACALP